jgi:hypothetical protein
MHSVSAIALTFKARVLGSTSARVALAVAAPHRGLRVERALRSVANSEAAMIGAYWKGRLDVPGLLERSHQLAHLRVLMKPSNPPSQQYQLEERLLNLCQRHRPRDMDMSTRPAKALQAVMTADATAARARNALVTSYWNGELNDFKAFRTMFRDATAGDSHRSNGPDALSLAAAYQLKAQAPEIGHGRELARLERFIEQLGLAAVLDPARRDSAASLAPSRISRHDVASNAAISGSGDDDSGWESDDSGTCDVRESSASSSDINETSV